MKIADIAIIAAAGLAVVIILAATKKTAAPSISRAGVTPITATNPYGIAAWDVTPWNYQTEIPMQPGGGY